MRLFRSQTDGWGSSGGDAGNTGSKRSDKSKDGYVAMDTGDAVPRRKCSVVRTLFESIGTVESTPFHSALLTYSSLPSAGLALCNIDAFLSTVPYATSIG
mmetsp:Transcript_17495/g.48551  ORF Transcript_17495/g.48551 Transcript_17495/m.48551 type:complete len:100 (-) Transcript_17495:1175-1474(-)